MKGTAPIKMNDLKSMLSSDKPLAHPDQDEFEYSPFAQIVAKSIVNMSPPDGLVMSLNGPWGAGKTTALNFVVYYLKQCEFELQPIIVHFNPWWFSNRENLIRLLIDQVRAAVGQRDYSDLRKKLADFSELVSRLPSVPGGSLGSFIAEKLRHEPDFFH